MKKYSFSLSELQKDTVQRLYDRVALLEEQNKDLIDLCCAFIKAKEADDYLIFDPKTYNYMDKFIELKDKFKNKYGEK